MLDRCRLGGRYVLERHAGGTVLVEHLGLRLADVEYAVGRSRAACTGRHAAHHEYPNADDEHPRQHRNEQVGPHVAAVVVSQWYLLPVLALRLVEILTERVHRTDIERKLHAVSGQIAILLLFAVFLDGGIGKVHFGRLLVDDFDFCDLSPYNHVLYGIPVGFLGSLCTAEKGIADYDCGYHRPSPHERILQAEHFRSGFAPAVLRIFIFRRHKILYSSLSYFTTGASAQSCSSL